MSTSPSDWPPEVWAAINDAVTSEVGKVRTGQKVISSPPATDNPDSIPDEVIDFTNMTIREGDKKQFVTIYREFSLSDNQAVEKDQRTCKTLARMAAKELALAEDAYLFQVSDRQAPRPGAIPVLSNPQLHVDNWRPDRDFGLLGEANPSEGQASDSDPSKVAKPIVVELADDKHGYGDNTFAAVANGIAKLASKGQAPNYALFLPTTVYADTFVRAAPGSSDTTADRIKPLVLEGMWGLGVLPADEGLLVALGGDPMTVWQGQEATAEWVRKEGGRHFFKVVERVQYVVRDPRSLVLLKFADPGQ